MTGPVQASPGSIAQNARSRFLIGPTVAQLLSSRVGYPVGRDADKSLFVPFCPQMAVLVSAEPLLESRPGAYSPN